MNNKVYPICYRGYYEHEGRPDPNDKEVGKIIWATAELNNPTTERKPSMKDSTPNATVIPNDEFSKLVTKAYKYDRLVAILKEHLDDPDDIVMVKDLCLRAESDEKLDMLMDAGGFDSYDEMLEEIESWKNRG